MEEKCEKSIDLIDVCRRTISAWQYIDHKLTYQKLIRIETDCPYPDVKSFAPQFHSMAVSQSVRVDAVCTKFTLKDTMNELFDSTGPKDLKNISTVKNLFANEDRDKMSFKNKEDMYWLIRLRYACGIVPISVLKMIPHLMKLGYKSWKMPNNDVVPFADSWLGDIYVSPKTYHIIIKELTFGSEIMYTHTEPVEAISAFKENNYHFVQHSIIFTKSKSAGKCPYVIDPTSLQFRLRGPKEGLIMHADFDEYIRRWILMGGEVESDGIQEGKEAEERLENRWRIGNLKDRHCELLIESVIKNIGKPACNHCGEVQNVHIRLLECVRCKSAKYCDKLCQKAAWKIHKGECKADC